MTTTKDIFPNLISTDVGLKLWMRPANLKQYCFSIELLNRPSYEHGTIEARNIQDK